MKQDKQEEIKNEDEEIFKEAYNLWEDFKNEILYKNRFIIKHILLDYVTKVAENNIRIISEGTKLYRARKYTESSNFLYYYNLNKLNDEFAKNSKNFNDSIDHLLFLEEYYNQYKTKIELDFYGYNKKDSFVPPDNILVDDGRTNPVLIKYLYTSEEPYTAIVEVRPYLNSRVSVAEIIVNSQIKVCNLSWEAIDSENKFEQYLIYLILEDFSKPVDSEKYMYIPTQYIAEYIKNLGFDGIRFNSSLYSRGRNITIFNYHYCEPIGSKLYEIEDICFDIKAIAPKNEKSLVHYKLKSYQGDSEIVCK